MRKAVWCARELGVDFRRIDAGFHFGVVDTAPFRSRNPNAMVPVIEDDDQAGPFTLWESNVIVRYLCAKYSLGNLYPETLRERFDAERWMDWQQTTLNEAVRPAFRQLVRTAEGARQPDLIAASVAKVEALLKILNTHLAGREFILGTRFTMSDIPLGCEVSRWLRMPVGHEPGRLPHLERWACAMASRSAADGVLDVPLE